MWLPDASGGEGPAMLPVNSSTLLLCEAADWLALPHFSPCTALGKQRWLFSCALEIRLSWVEDSEFTVSQRNQKSGFDELLKTSTWTDVLINPWTWINRTALACVKYDRFCSFEYSIMEKLSCSARRSHEVAVACHVTPPPGSPDQVWKGSGKWSLKVQLWGNVSRTYHLCRLFSVQNQILW